MIGRFEKSLAVWALTPNGVTLAKRIADGYEPGVATVLISQKQARPGFECQRFERLSDAVENEFNCYDGHVFIMATGIVVRIIARLIQHKTSDPAVVVMDEKGRYAISLVSGHIGGANALALTVSRITGGQPVITTATDINGMPAIDTIAIEHNLVIENPAAIKTVNMAFISGNTVPLHDPYGTLKHELTDRYSGFSIVDKESFEEGCCGVYISDRVCCLPRSVLVLRPRILMAGIGCNRNTEKEEIETLLMEVMKTYCLSPLSLKSIGTIDLKSDEKGILDVGYTLGLPIEFFSADQLDKVTKIENPSTVVEKYIGVKSVCEAAAILAAKHGNLIVPKRNTKNATVAIARIHSIS